MEEVWEEYFVKIRKLDKNSKERNNYHYATKPGGGANIYIVP